MNKPKISIIVPIYNVEKYFKRCVESLLNQTLQDIEIILVDDESPDNCPMICEEYAAIDSRIKVIHKENGGLGYARNSGLEIATGEYVAFVDSDDYVDVTMYEKLYSTAKKYSLDTVYCGFNNLDNNLKVHSESEVSKLTIFDSKEKIQGVLLDMIACEPSSRIERKYRMSVWHSLYSRELINNKKIRFCSEREFISEDIIFDIHYLTSASKIAFIPDSLYYYCYNDNSLTTLFREDRLKKHIILYKELIRQFDLLNYKKSVFKQRVDRFFIGYVRTNIRGISSANIPFNEKKKLINEICIDPIWACLNDYPFNKMPIKHKIIMYLIRHKKPLILDGIFRLL